MTTTIPLVAVVGATGTGKSAFSLELAHSLRDVGLTVEVVNADAMQLYRGMDIGTAKLNEAERQGVTHHLIDALEVTDDATVSWFQAAARSAIAEIVTRGNIPVLVGGSGLYVSSVLFDFTFPGHDDTVRRELEEESQRVGIGELYARLRDLAPDTAARIDPKNERRVIRALEVVSISGSGADLGTLSAQGTEPVRPWADTTVVQCCEPRESLVPRLDARVRHMWEAGLVAEAQSLIPRGLERGVTASRAIGYAQALGVVHGRMTDDEAIAETQLLTRRYARRQVSWFARYADVTPVRVTPAGSEEAVNRLVSRVREVLAP